MIGIDTDNPPLAAINPRVVRLTARYAGAAKYAKADLPADEIFATRDRFVRRVS